MRGASSGRGIVTGSRLAVVPGSVWIGRCLGLGPGSGASLGVGLASRPPACHQPLPLPPQTRGQQAALGPGRQVGWHHLPQVPARVVHGPLPSQQRARLRLLPEARAFCHQMQEALTGRA
eukprot:4448962-Heterocapsa_arctica.AAC.1